MAWLQGYPPMEACTIQGPADLSGGTKTSWASICINRLMQLVIFIKLVKKIINYFISLGSLLMRGEFIRTEGKDPKLSFQGQNFSDGKAKISTDPRVRCS